MDNKKNTILLTVIAVATLLVAVVGATFAYFTAQGGNAAENTVTVQTGTAGSSSFDVKESQLKLEADATTFSKTTGSITSSEATGTVNFTAPGAAGGQTPAAKDLQFCYKVEVEITKNDFEYSLGTDKPELLLTIKKNGTNIQTVTGIDGVTYKTATDRLTQSYSGFDITNGVVGTLTVSGENKLTAAAGQNATPDNWVVTMTLVNYEGDQNKNTDNSLTGKVKYTTVDCA